MDGLCGVYAIINALSVTSDEVDGEAILRVACSALPKSRWPDVLWKGTTIFDLQKMIRRCLEELKISDTRVSYPYIRNTPSTNERYWAGFDEAFETGAARCAIMGTTSPDMHWIVAGPNGGHIEFMDSTIGRPFTRKRRSSLFAGERRQKKNQWLLDRRELILFERV